MTQGTTLPNPEGQTATAPSWLLRMVGFLALFSGFTLAFLLMFSGALKEGLVVAAATLVMVPVLSLVISLLWRFFWSLMAALLGLLVLILIGTWWGVMEGTIHLPKKSQELLTLLGKGNPIGVILAIMIAGLAAASIARIYTLWQMGELRRLRYRLSGQQGDALFNFETSGPSAFPPATTSLESRVMNHLNQTGHRGEVKGDLVYVYKRRDLVGIVRLVESAGAISPVIVKDVDKQRTKFGVKVAYLATPGWFTEDVRQMADQIGVKLITV